MRYLLLVLAFISIGCAQKYQTYHVIKKSEFVFGKGHNPIAPKLLPGKKDKQETCEGQFFFNRNAKQITLSSIPALIKYSCPRSDYLVNAKITETWWTTLIYSKSCIELESFCPTSR